MIEALQKHLKGKGEDISGFAQDIGVSYAAASRYLNGKRIPTYDVMIRIYKWSSGKISPNDFYDLPVLKNSRTALESAGGAYRGAGLEGGSLLQRSAGRGAQEERRHSPDVLPGQIDMFAKNNDVRACS